MTSSLSFTEAAGAVFAGSSPPRQKMRIRTISRMSRIPPPIPPKRSFCFLVKFPQNAVSLARMSRLFARTAVSPPTLPPDAVFFPDA